MLSNLGDEKVADFEIKFSEKCGSIKENQVDVSSLFVIYFGNITYFLSFYKKKCKQTIVNAKKTIKNIIILIKLYLISKN